MKFKYSIGNNKIGKDTLIFNMGSATDCAAKLKGLCNIDCYALKAEKQYPAPLAARRHQEKYWLTTPYEQIVKDLSKAINTRKNHKASTPIKYIRVNESGDLHSEACLHKLIFLAESMPDVKFYTYTHRSDLIDDNTHLFMPKNLTLNTSDFKRKGLNSFQAVKLKNAFRSYKNNTAAIKAELKTISNSNFNCGGDCSICSLCKVTHTKDIYVAYH
tara:strand:- start:2398 stop:3045 length:648 start_codon:yes stop_codon:yes gene_type:complete